MPAITAAAASTAIMMLLPPAFDVAALAGARTEVDATERLEAGLADAASAGAAAIEIADMATRNFENRIINSLLVRLNSHPDAAYGTEISTLQGSLARKFTFTTKNDAPHHFA